jgi:hypothetical protein
MRGELVSRIMRLSGFSPPNSSRNNDMQGDDMTTEKEEKHLLTSKILETLARTSADEAGITLSEIWLDDASSLDCLDMNILSLSCMGKSAIVILSHSEMDGIFRENGLKLAKAKVHKAVSSLLEQLYGL